MPDPTLTVVIPVWNEIEVLPATYRRLTDVLVGMGVTYEILFVDDGSTDGTWFALEDLHRADPNVGCIALSRNFGHQVAITAGIDHARGDAVVVMDADLQDPPEALPRMLALWRDGHDVVYGVRTAREQDGAFKRWTASAFYRVIRALTAVDIPADTGDFRLMSRRVVEATKRMPERNRYVRGLVSWAGYKQAALPYQRGPRAAGVTKYPLRRMLRLAADAIVSFSTVPLQLAIGLGLLVSAGCFAYAGWAAYGSFVHDRPLSSGTPVSVAILLVGSVQLVCLGIVGEYIGRIHDEVRRRPLYFVADQLQHEGVARVLRTAP
jgi:glycosyltransferase involved in cell wall biosynthesis